MQARILLYLSPKNFMVFDTIVMEMFYDLYFQLFVVNI